MKKPIIAILLLLTSISSFSADVIISNVSVISATETNIAPPVNVHIRDELIVAISSKEIVTREPAIIIDGSDKFLIPGLMDSHVHVSSMPGETRDPHKIAELKKQFFAQQPRSYLYFGVTQILDPSNSPQAIAQFKQHQHRPELFHCGAMPVKGGYPTMWSSEQKIRSTFKYLLQQKDSEHEIAKLIAKMAKDGVSCIKVFIEDGFDLRSGWPVISDQQLAWIRKFAKQHKLPVFAHANALDMQMIAAKNQVDIMAHGMWNWNQYHGEPDIPSEIRRLLDDVIQQKIVYQPTFNVMDGIKGVLVPGVLEDPLYRKVIPQDIWNWYQTEEGKWFAREMHKEFGGGSLNAIFKRQDTIINQGERVVQYLYKNGHPMVLASDTPSSPTFAAQPGYSTFNELKHMAEVGITLPDILAAATINNARSFNLDHLYGSVTIGKIANLLLLEANPLETIEAYNSIAKVILKGEVIERESLAAQ